ncbi:hypothetical protein EDI_044930 [Entamoeba dispar SAW760]|uniref:CNH domain-containing protein n=1 Tax=Entamoeba dispar (strain ATCC PRA-260 / SAW760) TaxID=370354 RepID=B0EHZ3_ENTDS|nr:uncharacterized protein EDI_044930 [Entamoeba dispar SAW760]EDR25937.1 hypothetical protein EDI_044930 [Entamoeba dispar SAW760]|eukprot:EDR25937.1 hypothetical protein EDI_044930 [Entamoeba dispar SAW760]
MTEYMGFPLLVIASEQGIRFIKYKKEYCCPLQHVLYPIEGIKQVCLFNQYVLYFTHSYSKTSSPSRLFFFKLESNIFDDLESPKENHATIKQKKSININLIQTPLNSRIISMKIIGKYIIVLCFDMLFCFDQEIKYVFSTPVNHPNGMTTSQSSINIMYTSNNHYYVDEKKFKDNKILDNTITHQDCYWRETVSLIMNNSGECDNNEYTIISKIISSSIEIKILQGVNEKNKFIINRPHDPTIRFVGAYGKRNNRVMFIGINNYIYSVIISLDNPKMNKKETKEPFSFGKSSSLITFGDKKAEKETQCYVNIFHGNVQTIFSYDFLTNKLQKEMTTMIGKL